MCCTRLLIGMAALVGICAAPINGYSSPMVPGTGKVLHEIFDNFENEGWHFEHNHPKSSRNMDGRERLPIGESTNGLWYEGYKRGQPDVVKRVKTPPGGLPGSEGALMLKTLQSGIPGRGSRIDQQDDLILDSTPVGNIWTKDAPSVVVHVYFPPWQEWENSSHWHFGMRCCVRGEMPPKLRGGFLGMFKGRRKVDRYWPGMFIKFNSEEDTGSADSATLFLRADEYGSDFPFMDIKETGWWTFGFSFTPDGAVHYYASQGVDPLTQSDYLTTKFPYGAKTKRLETLFLNVCSQNNRKSWSTGFIIDDPKIYINPGYAKGNKARKVP